MVAEAPSPNRHGVRAAPPSPPKATLRDDSGFQGTPQSVFLPAHEESLAPPPGFTSDSPSTPAAGIEEPRFSMVTPPPPFQADPSAPAFLPPPPQTPEAAGEGPSQAPLVVPSFLLAHTEEVPHASTPSAAAAAAPAFRLTPVAADEESGQDTSHLIPNPFLSRAELDVVAHPLSFGSHPFRNVLRVLTQASLLNCTRTEGDAELTTLTFGEPMIEEDTPGVERERKPRWVVHTLRTAAPHRLLIHMGEAVVYMECDPPLVSKSFRKAPLQTQEGSLRKDILNNCASPPVKQVMDDIFLARCAELLALFFPLDQYRHSQHFRKTGSTFIHFLFSGPTTPDMPNTWYVVAVLRRTVAPFLYSRPINIPELPSFYEWSHKRRREFVPSFICLINKVEASLLRGRPRDSFGDGTVTHANKPQGEAE